MNAAKRKQEIEKRGTGDTPVRLMRNGEDIFTLGRLAERDDEVEARGLYRAPHGVEADTLFGLENPDADPIATEIALERAASNGRNIFWEGGPGGAASSPEELRAHGPKEARRRAMERATQWRALPECAQGVGWGCSLPFWAWTLSPDQYWSGPSGKHLAYLVWGCDWWYRNHLETGLRDWALHVFRKYGLRPDFGRGSEFWRREGKDIPRLYRWEVAGEYVLTKDDVAPEGAIEAGLVPAHPF